MPCLLENEKTIKADAFIDIAKNHVDIFPFELSNFQKFAIQAIVEGHHSLTCVPTGSGKTVPALFAIHYFTKKNQRVIYTSPIKALSNQKYKEFSEKFPNISFGIVTGDIKINLNAQVLIMTAEILQYKLLNKDRKTDFDIDFDTVGCIIHDEVHMINDANRGHVWENCISISPPRIQMILLSATLADPYEFATWIENSNPCKKVYVSNLMKIVIHAKKFMSQT
jgi:ATP-dependent RNA helicase DOB1